MKKVKIKVDYTKLQQSHLPKEKVGKFWNLIFQLQHRKFLNAINDELKSSANVLFPKIGLLQDSDKIEVNLEFGEDRHNISDFKKKEYKKVIFYFKYKNRGFLNSINTENNKLMIFEHYFINKDISKDADAFLSLYKRSINKINSDMIFFKKDIKFVELCRSGEKREINDNNKIDDSYMQYESSRHLCEKLLFFCEATKNYNFLKNIPLSRDIDALTITLKFKINVKKELEWCVSLQGVFHEMCFSEVVYEKESEYRTENEISNLNIFKAITETGVYKGIDFSDMNEENWIEYLKMTDLMSY